MGALQRLGMNRGNDADDAGAAGPSSRRRVSSTNPPSSTERPSPSSRRERLRDGRRTSTLKIRPWSQLPGVVAYLVLDGDDQITDLWGDPEGEAVERATLFRTRVRQGRFDGSHLLEVCRPGRRLLSVARRDGWFVHVWIEGPTEVAGILAIVGG